jgi:two-component system cell cycle sensor histidine kinase/response regulator CckA
LQSQEPTVTQGQGSVFSFIKAYTARMKQTPPGPIRVLVVDDEEPVRKFVDRVLREVGYETTVAGDGPDALQAVQRMESIDILVTDVMMPQMTGDELARRMRHDLPGLKVLYLTGYSDRLFKDKVTLWEDEAFLDKPCSVKGLQQAVALLLFGQFERPGVQPRTA